MERDAPLTSLAGVAAVDAPLGRDGSVSVRLRFASPGEVGAGGIDGGVRVPLSAAIVIESARSRSQVMAWRRATRSGGSARTAAATSNFCDETRPVL
jgi:hypothetical protein